MSLIIITALAFTAGLITDIVSTFYFKSIQHNKAALAFMWCIVLESLGIYQLFVIVDKHPAPIVGAIAGSAIGTYIGIKIREYRKKQKEKEDGNSGTDCPEENHV